MSEESPELGAVVEVELVINDEFRFEALGVVVRVATRLDQDHVPGFAVLFTDLSDERSEQLLDLVDVALDRMIQQMTRQMSKDPQ
jgi:hypothetical protein